MATRMHVDKGASSPPRPADGRPPPPEGIRIAAAGDLHCREAQRTEVAEALRGVGQDADLLLLAGDLTAHGDPAEAEILAELCADLEMPIFAVLGNHDWHCDQGVE